MSPEDRRERREIERMAREFELDQQRAYLRQISEPPWTEELDKATGSLTYEPAEPWLADFVWLTGGGIIIRDQARQIRAVIPFADILSFSVLARREWLFAKVRLQSGVKTRLRVDTSNLGLWRETLSKAGVRKSFF